MMTSEITMMDGVPALRLTQESLDVLGVEMGDEVEIIIAERRLILQAAVPAERKAKMDKIFAELMIERDSAYRKLAEGVK